MSPMTDPFARRSAAHLGKFRRSHPAIDLVHYAVAATAELHEAELATLNVKHLPMIKGRRHRGDVHYPRSAL